MELFDRRSVKDAALDSIARASYNPKTLILIHTGCTLMLSIIIAIINTLLSNRMDSAGGLHGMGMLTALSTAQVLLVYIQIFLLPFWQAGYTYATLQISRREYAGPGSLLEGFRRFGPMLRLLLLQAILYLAVAMAAMYIATFLFGMLPFSEPLMTAMMDPTASEETIFEATMAAYPYIFAIFIPVFLPLFLPMFYRYRMAAYCLLNDPGRGALLALRESRAMMYGSRMALFKLDLSFWWFYGLEVLVNVVMYGDFILPALGVSLPWSAAASYYIFLALSALCQLALYWWRKNEVDVTYAHVYAALRQPPQEKNQTVIDV